MIIKELFQEKLPTKLPDFEKRIGQEEMAQKIYDNLLRENNLIIEAGTGIGKSIAYLIPAVLWSLENNEKVLITTNTKNLQDQLLYKDIPLVRDLFGEEERAFTAAVVKGRNNYLCLRRLESYKNSLGVHNNKPQKTFFDEDLKEENKQLMEIIRQLEKGCGGERDEFEINHNKIWYKINAEKDFCLYNYCSWKNNCCLTNIRILANEADLILVNHSLFLSDLLLKAEGENSILPDYRRVIIDEAHHFEDAVCSSLTVSLDYQKIRTLIHSLISSSSEVTAAVRIDENYYHKLKDLSNEIEEKFLKLSNNISAFLDGEIYKRYKDSFFLANGPVKKFEELLNIVSSKNFENTLKLSKEGKAELEVIINSGKKLLADIKFLLEVKGEQTHVFWAEKERREEQPTLKASPIFVDEILNDLLFSNTSVILTSATLSISNNCRYIAERLGIKDYEEELIDSPFDYKKNCLLYIPRETVSPKDFGYYEYIIENSMKILEITEGSAFLLFTSFEAMNYCYSRMEKWLQLKGYESFVQSPGFSRNKLLKRFKAACNPVLFGTNSFWEGVDVAGDKLSCVIITRLPFSVPTKPLEEARIEILRKKGINDFLNYHVPKASIRLKQGFGRLIRSSKDKGIVVLLDSRAVEANYSRYFLNSLPPTFLQREIEAVESFFKNS